MKTVKEAGRNVGRLALNEDDSHFFSSRTGDEMTVQGLKELVDHYVTGNPVIFSPPKSRSVKEA